MNKSNLARTGSILPKPLVRNYLLYVRADKSEIPEIEGVLSRKFPYRWGRAIFDPHEGDRTVYSLPPEATNEELLAVTAKLLEMKVQSFEFKDWRNTRTPPTRMVVVKTGEPIF